MKLNANTRAVPLAPSTAAAIGTLSYLDPLDDDRPDDAVVVTTRRAIARVALVAAETAGRFQREGVSHDAMSWMLAPRALFDGVTALEACLDRDACVRGILIHGLSLGMDADPATIDALTSGDERDQVPTATEAGARRSNVLQFRDSNEAGLRLFTATIVASDGHETVHAFHASLASAEAEVAGRLFSRIGPSSLCARIMDGFDPADPLVGALVSEAMCDTLAIIATQPGSPIAAGLDLNIEQRFRD